MINFSVVDLLRTYRTSIIPSCDVIANVPQPADDRYRNATRFFAARPPPSSSRDRTGDDVTASRDRGNPAAATPNDVTTLKLVLVALDALVLLYRVTHVCRAVNRMWSCRSRDRRKYCYDDADDDDEYASRERTIRDASGRAGLDHVDEGLYQLPPPSSSSSCLVESTAVCRLARSSHVGKLVLFAALVTWCHVTLHVIDRLHAPAAGDASLVSLARNSASLAALDTDVASFYRSQRHDAATYFHEFVINSLSNLSVIVQLINNRNFTSFTLPTLLCLYMLEKDINK